MKRLIVLAAIAAAGINTAEAEDLRIGISVEASALDPHFHNAQQNLQISRHLYDFLVARDHRQALKPGLAESWRAVDDNSWEFKLRRGVKWHDGSALTVDDVIFTVGRVPNVPNSPGGYAVYAANKQIVKIDDTTFQVKTEKPQPLTPNDLSTFAVISKKYGEGAATQDYNAGKAAVGTGPYKIVEFIKGDRLVMQANPDYWGGKPKWDKVTFKPISSDPSRIAAVLSGDVDIIDAVPTTDVRTLRADGRVTLSQSPSNRVVFYSADANRHVSPFVLTNDGKPMFPNPFRDQRVRKAVSMAINRDAIVERVMEGAAVAAGQMVPAGFFGYDPSLKPEPFDPDGAKKLLAQAGYGDGFRVTVHSTSGRYPNDAKITEAIAQMLTRIGIKAEVQTVPTAVYFTRASKLEFSFAMFTYGSDTGEASSPLNGVLHTTNANTGAGAFNRARYSNVLYDAKIEEALVTVDDAKREKLLQEATQIAITDVAFIPTHYQVNTWAMKKGLAYEARTDENTLAESASRAR